MKSLKLNLIFLLSLISLEVNSQELTHGDSTIVKNIKSKAFKIYETKNKTDFFLTKKQLLDKKTFASNIVVHSNDGITNRIIAISTIKKGILSSEYYFEEGKVIYIYQTFEFFDEYKELSKWKNFKDLSAWESKYYLVNNSIKFQKQKGKNLIKQNAELYQIYNEAKSILRFANNRIDTKNE